MKYRPILFNGPMVRAVLARKKTETRRVVKGESCPYGAPGDRLWVRETWWEHPQLHQIIHYDADMDEWEPKIAREVGWIKRPSIFMPRRASRVTLEVTGVRVERAWDISDKDIEAEGVEAMGNGCGAVERHKGKAYTTLRGAFVILWNDINIKRGYGWDTNPLVWVIGFRRLPQST